MHQRVVKRLRELTVAHEAMKDKDSTSEEEEQQVHRRKKKGFEVRYEPHRGFNSGEEGN